MVKGTAEITNGDQVGQAHRLANLGTIPLEIIEVQSGSYFGKNDIVRFEDKYGK